MFMLSTHLASNSSIITTDQRDNNLNSYDASTCYSIIVDLIFSSKNIWIVDAGITTHVCSIPAAFTSMRIIDNSTVTLPNHTQILVRLCGDVKLSSNIVLHVSYSCLSSMRLSFDSNNHLSNHPFDLIHCDIWRPYQVTSYTWHSCFWTSVDDCSRFTWIYILKHKSDAANVIPRFFQYGDTVLCQN